MCSLIPLYRGKEFNDLSDAPLHCLPHVLGEVGYETLIYSASDEPSFERSKEFFGHIGFNDVRFEDPALRAGDPRVCARGLQDDVYYRKLFPLLDEKGLENETAVLRGTIARIRESQAILRAKRVWPGLKTEELSISR